MIMDFPLNTLGIVHRFLSEHVPSGGLCIDATAGKGRDTAFLCSLVGPLGKVLAFDIQPEAIAATDALLTKQHLRDRAELFCKSHHQMAEHAAPETVDAVVFNFGWLPGGNHNVFTHAETSIPAIEAGLSLLKPGGVMTLCIYSGKENGFDERDALLDFLQTVDPKRYTVLVSSFYNRTGNPPIPVFIWKET